jgi:DNA-binding beta-propeller fold protein YncE
MRFRRSVLRIIGVIVATVVLYGCPGGSPALPFIRSSNIDQHVRTSARRQIFVSDYLANTIQLYDDQGNAVTPAGVITRGVDGPLGTAVDQTGRLYVTNLIANTLAEYVPGSTVPTVILTSGIDGPMNVAVDARGDIAVGQYANHQSSIVEFKSGDEHLSVRIVSLTYPAGVVFDANRLLWVAWNVQGNNGLVGHVSTCKLFAVHCTNTGITIGQTGGIAIDSAGDLLLGDQTHSVIDVFAPGATKPFRKIRTTSHDPYGFAFDSSERKIYVADYTSGTIVIYNFSTGQEVGTIAQGLTSAWGVSLSPPADYGP